MSVIRKLKDVDFKAWVDISTNAYPGFKVNTPEEKQKMEERLIKLQNEEPTLDFYGVFRDENLVGGMRIHDYDLNLFNQSIKATGIGSVAVDLLHKKEKIAKEITDFYLKHTLAVGAPMAMLYPFRPDFYKSMGFGYGTKMSQYRVRPCDIPKGYIKKNLRFYDNNDRDLIIMCYNRYKEKTHGVIRMTEYDFNGFMSRMENKLVYCMVDGKVTGYIIFSFERANDKNLLTNDIVVKQLVYEDTDALMELFTFLNSQQDQVNRVVFNTQDESFHHLLRDPRDHSDNMFAPVYHQSNLQGIGIMYRVLDVKGIFRALTLHNFNNQQCSVKINIHDSFLPENSGGTVVHFKNGRPFVFEEDDSYEVEITMDISDFSSLIIGAIEFKALHKYGLAQISDNHYIDIINRLFRAEEKPICLTSF